MLAHALSVFRCVWLAGRPGSGKTALSVHLALGLANSGWARRIISNIELRGVGRYLGYVGTMEEARSIEDSAFILDEAWQYLGRGVSVKDVRAWFAQIRHYNQFLILPSVLALTDQARSFEVRRMLNLVPVGIPLWLYRWQVSSGSDKDKGKFWWFRPQGVFDFYDHLGTTSEGFYVYTLDEQDTLSIDSSSSPDCKEGLGGREQVLVYDRTGFHPCGYCGGLGGVVCTDLQSRARESAHPVGHTNGKVGDTGGSGLFETESGSNS